MTERGLEIHEYNEKGYKPLVYSQDWMVSILNWEPIFDLDKIGQIERHNQTDEVFVLTRGRAVLFTIDDRGMQVEEMKLGAVYNVRKGVWHNLVSNPDASWIIVENRDTNLNDCEYRKLSKDELILLKSHLPAWFVQEG